MECTATVVHLMFAYLDAGTGSMLAAALAGGVAGVAVFVRLYWHRFLGLFSAKHREQAKEAAEQLTGDAQDAV